MKLHNMFKKTNTENRRISLAKEKPEAPEGLLKKCNKCGRAILTAEVIAGSYICPKCHGYFRLPAHKRIEMISDEGTFEEWDSEMEFSDSLEFKGYREKVSRLKETTGLNEAVVTGRALIGGHPAVLGVCDGRFLMASMGRNVGEKIARAVERATQERLPVILFACSGGARMQEGIVSLMQMAKTAAAIKRHSMAGQLFISVLTDPTTGGVTASFAMLGDIILAEPNALIGFAGPRVIEQTIGQKLPKGFQRSEFLLEHGFVDQIVERENMKAALTAILSLHEKNDEKEERISDGIAEEKCFSQENDTVRRTCRSPLSAWDRVLLSRKKNRPVGTDYVRALFPEFIELHGDRYFGDDHAIIGGIARFDGQPVTVIAHAKGTTTKENLERSFGMPSPEGYRKALRLMKQAEKFNRPILCFVDTPGAFCGLEAEERGQGEAIARNLFEMSSLKVPILSVVIGEGGSGGALALAVADQVWMLENSIYSILSPEGFASILWKDSKRASEAAEKMKLTADELKKLGVIDKIISEPEELKAETFSSVIQILRSEIAQFLAEYGALSTEELTEKRYRWFRGM